MKANQNFDQIRVLKFNHKRLRCQIVNSINVDKTINKTHLISSSLTLELKFQ